SHARSNVAVLLRQCRHQSCEKRRVRDLVDWSWTRRQRTILDPQVRNTVVNTVTRAIPAPDSAVVHSQCRQQRRLAASQYLKRVFVRLRDHDRTKARNLIGKKFDYRISQPSIAETHTGGLAARQLRTRTFIGGVLKQGHTRFLPQAVTKEQRRIYRGGEHGRSDRLRDVVLIHELFRA